MSISQRLGRLPIASADAAAARDSAREANGRFGEQQRPESMLPDLMAAGEAYRQGVEQTVYLAGGMTIQARSDIDRLTREHEDRIHRILASFAAREPQEETDATMAGAGYVPSAPGMNLLRTRLGGNTMTEARPKIVAPATQLAALASVENYRDKVSSPGRSAWVESSKMQVEGNKILAELRDEQPFMKHEDRARVLELHHAVTSLYDRDTYDQVASDRLADALLDVTDR